jgi:hypothetical protein
MIAQKQTFKDLTISLDGSTFVGCTFNHCKLIYSGMLPVTLEDNVFNNCSWDFSGAARNTVGFMSALYMGGGKELIEATIDNIRGKANPAAVRTQH